jgi:methionine sulfoxide reductase heme-binding subunit
MTTGLMTRVQFTTRILKPLAALAATGPAVWLVLAALGRVDFGADPVKTIQVTTGLATLVLLLATLAITPLRKYAHWSELIRLRRMLGLFAFFYVLLHAVTYFVFDQSLDPGLIWTDTVEHPRIAVGFLAFVLLIPLAATSTDRMVRRLGKRWARLHRLIYVASALGILHYLMVQKLDLRKGMVYGVVFGVLMLIRVPGLVQRAVAKREGETGRRNFAQREG